MNTSKYRLALVAIAAAAFYSDLIAFLMDAKLIPFTVTHAFLLFAIACLPVLTRPPADRGPRQAVFFWCFASLVVIFASLIWAQLGEGGQTLFRNRVFGIIFLVLMLLLFSDRQACRFAAGAVVCVTLASVAINIYEMFAPGTFSTNPGRSAGLYENSNKSGAALVLGMIVGLEAVSMRWQVLYTLAVGVGVATTFSRSAMLGWALMASLAIAMRHGTGRFTRYALIVALAGAVSGPAVILYLEDKGMLDDNTTSRANFEIGGESDEFRFEAAQLALDAIVEHPFLGQGTGASVEPPFDFIGPHNIYLALMIEHGILGSLILPALLVASTWGAASEFRPITVPLAIFLSYWGFFSHNILEERYILFVVALATSFTAAPPPPRQATPGLIS